MKNCDTKTGSDSSNDLTVYFDESGSTELGFSDIAQPFITFASHSATEESCENAIKKHFLKSAALEIKYSAKRHLTKNIINLFDELNRNGALFKVYTVYRPFFLFNSMITSLYEPAIESIADDYPSGDPEFLFDRSHRFWFEFICAFGAQSLAETIMLYCKLVRERNDINYSNFVKHFQSLQQSDNHIVKLIYFELKHLGQRGVDEVYQENIFNSYIDLVLPCTLPLLYDWTHCFKGQKYTVIHDKSEPLKKYKNIISMIGEHSDSNTKEIQGRWHKEISWIIPNIQVSKVRFEDSKNYYGLQVADLLAGIVNDDSKSLVGLGKEINDDQTDTLYDLISHRGYKYMTPRFDLASSAERNIMCHKGIDMYCYREFEKYFKTRKL